MGRKLFGIVAALGLASAAMVGLVGTATAQEGRPTLTITVHKEITGTPASDQVYEFHVECTHDGEDVTVEPDNTQSVSWNSDTKTFTPSADAVFTLETRVGGDSDVDVTCTASETDQADAASHTIECTDATDPAVCNAPDDISIPYAETGDVELTVTNDYPPVTTTTTTTPPATVTPAPVVAPARFTG
jgi:hypothetical protein